MSNSKRNNHYFKFTLYTFLVLFLIVSLPVALYFILLKSNSEQTHIDTNESPTASEINTTTKITLNTIGDIMFHDDQLESALTDENTFDFHGMFADIKPYLSNADVTLANFETTLGGSGLNFVGYPFFNSPDEVADAIKNAGVDILTTANNHSLDTSANGLVRTVNVLQEKGFKTVGTYAKEPKSRVLIHEVNDIKLAILSYTESTNGLGNQYSADKLNAMINLMTKENIKRDVEEAKQLDADFIITFMHWGEEFMLDPNEKQIEYAHFMADIGVDLVLGSHPHVIQKTDTIKTNDKETFIVYSMGNFVSNQRVETLGEDFARTEDGVILNFTIEKDHELDETAITDVNFVPTWVYKIVDPHTNKPSYRILPIDDFLTDNEISDSFKTRMEQSYEATTSQVSAE